VFSIVPSFLVATGALLTPLWLVCWSCWSGVIVLCRVSLLTLFGHWKVLEPEWDLPSSLPLCPVFEKGIGIVDMNVVGLGESTTSWQILGEDEVIPGFLQPSPWDPSLVATSCNL
jgi:hypothetical protein